MGRPDYAHPEIPGMEETNKKITDLKDDYIASTITQDDLTKVSRQLNVSMGEMFYLVEGFAIVMFIMLIYLLTKMIIENNMNGIVSVKNTKFGALFTIKLPHC